jgi:hypothetical protein
VGLGLECEGGLFWTISRLGFAVVSRYIAVVAIANPVDPHVGLASILFLRTRLGPSVHASPVVS